MRDDRQESAERAEESRNVRTRWEYKRPSIWKTRDFRMFVWTALVGLVTALIFWLVK